MRKLKWCIVAICLLIPAMSYCKTPSEGDAVVSPTKVAEKEFVGMDTCAMCHEKIAKSFKRSDHARIVVHDKDKPDQACETCHGAGSLHANAEGRAEKHATIINPGKNSETCYQCHMDKKASFSLQYHHPVPEGKMGCVDCHDPHGEDAVKPNTIRSLSGKNSVCARCHKDQTRPYVFEHFALREGCTICHEVHGSINQKMLIERDANLCLKCHFQANFPTIGNTTAHGGTNARIQNGPCWSGSCHMAPHGSNYDKHLRIP